jgi:hypothetical protein
MASTTGGIQITVTAGSPTPVMTGTLLQDGVYLITVTQDNTGVSLDVATPYGDTGQSGFQKGDDVQ